MRFYMNVSTAVRDQMKDVEKVNADLIAFIEKKYDLKG